MSYKSLPYGSRLKFHQERFRLDRSQKAFVERMVKQREMLREVKVLSSLLFERLVDMA